MRQDTLIGVNQGEAPGLDVLLLRQGQQNIQKPLVRFEHLDELDQAAIGDIQLAIEAIGAGIGFGAVLPHRG
jgi:hypothetical protein